MMSAPHSRPRPGANRLLMSLPLSSRERLQARGRLVRVAVGQHLMHTGSPIEYVYFPFSGAVAHLVLMRDGRSVDVATTGFEGMVGTPALAGEEVSPHEAIVQVEGEGLRIPLGDFRHALHEDSALLATLLRFVEVFLIQIARTAACNRLHTVEERLARWLLHLHDCLWEDRFPLTQENLAAMLGVRRATVTLAIGALQQAGLITHRRGEVTIQDRRGLEHLVCEDYTAIRDAFERLLPFPSAQPRSVHSLRSVAHSGR